MEEKYVVIHGKVGDRAMILTYTCDRWTAWNKARKLFDNVLSVGEKTVKRFTEKEIKAYKQN